MPVVYGLLAAVALLLLIVLFVPVYVRICYTEELQVQLRVLGIPISLLPTAAGEKASKKAKKKSSDKAAKRSAKRQELFELFRRDSTEGTLQLIKEAAALVGRTTKRVLRAVTVDKLCLEMYISAQEAAATAVQYGRVCAVVYPGLSALGEAVRIRKQQLRVEPNFLAEVSAVQLDIRLHVAVYRLAAAGVWLLWRLLYMKNLEENKEAMRHGK